MTETREIAPGIHRMGSEIVYWYLVEDAGGLTAVDAGLAGFQDDLEADLSSIGRRIEDVAAVILTHSDGDHTGLAATFKEAGARVLIHALDEPALRKPGPKKGDASPARQLRLMWRSGFRRFMRGMVRAGGAKPPRVEGAETFEDGQVLDVPGSPRVVHTPGHTPGHSVLLFEGRSALFVGDAMCTWNPVDGTRDPQLLPSPLNEDNVATLGSLAAIEGLKAELLLPGHGEPWRDGPRAAAERARSLRQSG
ncbi:MAG: MBL fold metallo-hydrolase [Thermoleophilaceae bacterium]